jgi:hypothetical protein
MDLLLHRQQFVIARAPVLPDASWRQIDLPQGWVLSHQAALEVTIDARDAARPEIVLGSRFCADPVTGRGAGRYVHIRWPHLHTDPAALLGVHYGRIGEDFAVSSSAALAMQALTGAVPPYDITVPLEHRGTFNYIPTPGSRWRAVRRLFSDQRIDFATCAVEHADQGIRPLATFEAARDQAAAELVRFAEELKDRVAGTVYLSLTAGLDSRTLAAAFLAAGLPFEAATFRFIGKPDTDARVAAAISRRFGIRHQVIELAPLEPRLGALVERQCGAAHLDWDVSHLFPGGVYRYLRPGDAIIEGNGFELGRPTISARRFGDFNPARASGAEIWARLGGTPGPAALTAFLDDWRDWRNEHPLEGFGWINAFYLDQRLTAWYASVDQGLDLLPAVVLTPANSARVYSALVTPGFPDQLAGLVQRAVIDQLAPGLAGFPLNPPTLAARLRRIRRRIGRRLRGLGRNPPAHAARPGVTR